MDSETTQTILRAFVDTFPPIRVLLKLYDCICYIIKSITRFICWVFKSIFNFCYIGVKRWFSCLIALLPARFRSEQAYERLGKKAHTEPLPHRDDPIRRSLTYHGGILLGVALYIFVYYVLVKHHTYTSLTIGLLLLFAYLIIIENSHDIRSILMLCLPIMFTNRGRALVFCCMLAIMVSGPFKNTQLNVSELHMSMRCCKQFLIIKGDKFVDENVVQNLVKVEKVIDKLVSNIKQFAKEIREKFRILIQLAISVERYIALAFEKLKEIVNVCNTHTRDLYNNCYNTFNDAYLDCQSKLGRGLDVLCEVVQPLKDVCYVVRLPAVLCKIPRAIVEAIDKSIGDQLRLLMQVIENEFYVEVEVDHNYYYNGTKSKSYKKAISEIQFDVEQKFWYVRMITRVFNMVSLILVCWISITATLYHMHYLNNIEYDNMYLDNHLHKLDKKRRIKAEQAKLKKTEPKLDPIEYPPQTRPQLLDVDSYLFPMRKEQEKQYLKPFSLSMNETEKHKLCIASLVWVVIVGYIFFFVLLDFSLYKLISLINEILMDILFTSDLPLVDINTKSGDQVTHYNRTYLNYLRSKHEFRKVKGRFDNSSSINSMYRRLIDSIEEDVPDDVAILDSLQQCLPTASVPNFNKYKNLSYLALFTFLAVIAEAYALRTRHCIADLYYPKRAKKRAVWLYRKLLTEKPKFEKPQRFSNQPNDRKAKLIKLGLDAVRRKAK